MLCQTNIHNKIFYLWICFSSNQVSGKVCKLYLWIGLKQEKIYRVPEFNQSQFLKPYIEFNTNKKMEAERNKNNSGKVLWKLMNNARKAIKNLRNRIDVSLANSKID